MKKSLTASLGVNFLIFILLSITLVLSHPIWLPLPGKFLLVKDDLEKADCIVLLRGEEYFRFRKAVELVDLGYSKNIVVSRLSPRALEVKYNLERKISGLDRLSDQELVLKFFEYFGKDSEGVYFTDTEVVSTLEEAFATKQWMLQKGSQSMILVTNVYHMRRALLLFQLVFRGTGINIYRVTAETETRAPQRWWRKSGEASRLIQEYIAIFYNLYSYFVHRKGMNSLAPEAVPVPS